VDRKLKLRHKIRPALSVVVSMFAGLCDYYNHSQMLNVIPLHVYLACIKEVYSNHAHPEFQVWTSEARESFPLFVFLPLYAILQHGGKEGKGC